MFNPMCLFSGKLLEAFVKAEKIYFVRQEYQRATSSTDSDIKGIFLITHYDKLGDARQHIEAISEDKYRYLYDWNNLDNRQRLYVAATQPVGYRIYAAVVRPGWESHAKRVLKVKVRKYVEQQIKWFPAGRDVVEFDLYPHFGEVFVRMHFRKQEIKVSLAEVEKCF